MNNKQLDAFFQRYQSEDVYQHGGLANKDILVAWRTLSDYQTPCMWHHRLAWWQVVQVMIRTGTYHEDVKKALQFKKHEQYPIWPVHCPIPVQGWELVESLYHEVPELAAYIALNYLNFGWRAFAPHFMDDYFKLATVWMMFRTIDLPGSLFFVLSKDNRVMQEKMLETYNTQQLRHFKTLMIDLSSGVFDHQKNAIVPYMVGLVQDSVIMPMPQAAIQKKVEFPREK